MSTSEYATRRRLVDDRPQSFFSLSLRRRLSSSRLMRQLVKIVKQRATSGRPIPTRRDALPYRARFLCASFANYSSTPISRRVATFIHTKPGWGTRELLQIAWRAVASPARQYRTLPRPYVSAYPSRVYVRIFHLSQRKGLLQHPWILGFFDRAVTKQIYRGRRQKSTIFQQ